MSVEFVLIFGALVLVIVLLFLIKPNRKRVSTPPATLIAHRGLHSRELPENSLAAFAAAKTAGYGVELDVQLTLDKQVVVFHDPDLKRMCGVDKKVRDLTFAQLEEYTLANSEERIPLLSQVLDLLKDIPIICEIKPHNGNTNTEICPYVCEEIEKYQGIIWIESFSPFILRWFYQNRPEIMRGQLAMDFIKRREGLSLGEALAMKHLLVNFLGRPDFIAYRWDDDSFGFWLCRRLFNPLCFAWTLTDRKQRDLLKHKYDGFIFDP